MHPRINPKGLFFMPVCAILNHVEIWINITIDRIRNGG